MADENNQKRGTRSLLEIYPSDPMTIVLKSGKQFKTEKYLIGNHLVTAYGRWEYEGTAATEKSTLFIPLSSIDYLDIAAKEVPEENITQTEREMLEKRRKEAGQSTAAG